MTPTAWVAAVSHDLREPMNAIMGMTRLLLETSLDTSQRVYAEAIDDAASGMLSLINDLLDVSRLERGDLRVEAEAFDLRRLLANVLDVVRPRALGGEVSLCLAVAPGVPGWVIGDAGRLRQILLNLLVNGLKFTREGDVRLEVEPGADGTLVFTIVDSGCGLAADELVRLFRAFEQAVPGAGGGVGLGLTIVNLLVDRMGGRIDVTSKVGVGSRFRVHLPLRGAPAPAPAKRVSLAGRHVLVVDGPDELRVRLTRLLAAQGLTVQARSSLDAAVDGSERLDAILAVAVQPSAPTVAASAALKRRFPHLVRLAVDGSGLRGEAQAWRHAGFDGYLPHPTGGEVIVDALGLLLAQPPTQRTFVTVHSLEERGQGPLDILVVDDNPLNVKLVAILLERAGHRVAVANDGAEAVAAVAAGGIDIVLMDIQMPGMNGLEATRRIRALDGAAALVPVVAVTANALANDLAACRAAGMDDVVTKPVDATTLMAALSAATIAVPAN